LPATITDFSHTNRTYTSDSNATWQIGIRTVYIAASQLAAIGGNTGAPHFPSKHARRRYIYYIEPAAGKKDLHRHYPVAIANVTGAPAAPNGIDGLNWLLKGYRGEQDRP
jgi:hypothetical protein